MGKGLSREGLASTYLARRMLSSEYCITFRLSPEHNCIDQWFGLLARNVAEGGYQLVKFWIGARAAHFFYRGIGFI